MEGEGVTAPPFSSPNSTNHRSRCFSAALCGAVVVNGHCRRVKCVSGDKVVQLPVCVRYMADLWPWRGFLRAVIRVAVMDLWRED